MEKITVDECIRKKLASVESKVELCDETGKTLGFFMTPDRYRKMVTEWAKAQVSDEELERARGRTGGRLFSDVIAELRARCAGQ
jgi:predicted AAA+ superfamily ATPase